MDECEKSEGECEKKHNLLITVMNLSGKVLKGWNVCGLRGSSF